MADTPPTAAGPPQSGPSEPGPASIGSTSSETSSGRSTRRTRISGAWVAVVVAAVVLVLLLVFILQNTRSVKVSYFTVNGTMPLGVALLLAAVGGVLLAGVVSSLRIWQLRHRLNKSN
jgi:lipopolysaccharide assembly protein A